MCVTLDIFQHSNGAVQVAARARVPLAVAEDAEVVMFRNDSGGEDHFAVLIGTGASDPAPLVRLHSQCITGDVLGSPNATVVTSFKVRCG